MWIVARNARLVARLLALSPLNVMRDRRVRREVVRSRAPLADLTRYERRVYSQNGEDGILEAIFARIGTTNRYAVEFGVGDGTECNTRLLRERRGWGGLQLDAEHADPARGLRRAVVTAENVDALFDAHGVPDEPDLLGVDIDGNDLWVWRALAPRWRPRVVVIEYNASFGPDASVTVPYDPARVWDHRTTYFGASLRALVAVGRRRGYTLVTCDGFGVNAFFVRDDLVAAIGPPQDVARLYRPPGYGRHLAGHAPSPYALEPYDDAAG